jgi:hypothetical protein
MRLGYPSPGAMGRGFLSGCMHVWASVAASMNLRTVIVV